MTRIDKFIRSLPKLFQNVVKLSNKKLPSKRAFSVVLNGENFYVLCERRCAGIFTLKGRRIAGSDNWDFRCFHEDNFSKLSKYLHDQVIKDQQKRRFHKKSAEPDSADAMLKAAVQQLQMIYPKAAIIRKEGPKQMALLSFPPADDANDYNRTDVYVGLKNMTMFVFFGDHAYQYSTMGGGSGLQKKMKDRQAVIDAVLGMAALTKQREIALDEEEAEYERKMEEMMEAVQREDVCSPTSSSGSPTD